MENLNYHQTLILHNMRKITGMLIAEQAYYRNGKIDIGYSKDTLTKLEKAADLLYKATYEAIDALK